MSGSSENQNISSRELTLSFDQAAFALIGVTQRAGTLPLEAQKNFSSDVTAALRRLMLHEKKIPTGLTQYKIGKGAMHSIVSREGYAGHVLASDFDKMSAEKCVGLALTAINHAACLDPYRAAFEQNKEDYFLDDAVYRDYCRSTPKRILVKEPQGKGLIRKLFSFGSERDETMEKIVENVKTLFINPELPEESSEEDEEELPIRRRDEFDEKPFHLALDRNEPVVLNDFREKSRELWEKARAQHPRPAVQQDMLQAS
jgi:hypothetical protein